MLIIIPVLAALVLAFLDGVNSSTCYPLSPISCLTGMISSPAGAPHTIQQRIGLTSLSDELLAVIAALPPSNSTLERRDADIDYQQNLESNSDELDTLSRDADGASSTSRASTACQISQILFGDRVITPQSPLYTEEQQENWSQTCWLPAACFIRVQSTLEVAITMKIVTALQIKFAVRSGGHSPTPGFASVGKSGILLDLNALDQTTLSLDQDIAHVEPGTTWDKVYEQLEKQKLTVVGGRVAGVGVGGLITGGGMSHFSNHWGMACDNVKNFEVVLANSAVVNANAQENPDLFRALKGGQANFGIVTRFDLYTYPDYQVWYTFRVYNVSDRDAVMKASVEVQKAMDSNDRLGFFLSVSNSAFTAGMVHRGHTTLPSEFRAFDNITPLLTAVPETNGTALSVAQAAVVPGVAKREIGTASIKMDAKLYGDLHAVLQGIVNTTSYQLAFTYQPLGAAAVKKGQDKGGNSLNISPVNQSWLGIIAQWTDDKDDNLARSRIQALISEIKSTAKTRGLLLDFDFMNDASYTQSPLKSYGTNSLASLNAASRKYDPKGVFQKLQNSGFLLSKV